MKAFNIKTVIARNMWSEDLLVIARTASEAMDKAIRMSIKINGVKQWGHHKWRVVSFSERNEKLA